METFKRSHEVSQEFPTPRVSSTSSSPVHQTGFDNIATVANQGRACARLYKARGILANVNQR